MSYASDTILRARALLADDDLTAAADIRRAPGTVTAPVPPTMSTARYPSAVGVATKRRYSVTQRTQVFARDGFIDRYSGDRLIFPGVLRLLSHRLPTAFPFHPNWKFGIGHSRYWDLYATIDHVVPVTMQGVDGLENWVTTSMRRNLAKSNRSLADLGWA